MLMKTHKITIEENGAVSVPTNVRMRSFEIAALLGVYTQTVDAHIRAILKSGVVGVDISGPATVAGNTVVPDFHGLEMVVALAFPIHSPQALRFREWVIRRLSTGYIPPIPALFIPLPDGVQQPN